METWAGVAVGSRSFQMLATRVALWRGRIVGIASRRSGVGASMGVTPTEEMPWQRRGGTVQRLGILP